MSVLQWLSLFLVEYVFVILFVATTLLGLFAYAIGSLKGQRVVDAGLSKTQKSEWQKSLSWILTAKWTATYLATVLIAVLVMLIAWLAVAWVLHASFSPYF